MGIALNPPSSLAEAREGSGGSKAPFRLSPMNLPRSSSDMVQSRVTANLEKRGLDEGFETGVVLDSRDAEATGGYASNWEGSFPFELLVKKKMGEVEKEAILWTKDELRKVSIRGREEMELGEFRVNNIEEMEKFTPDFSKVAERGNEICHQQTFRWTVLAPMHNAAEQGPKA